MEATVLRVFFVTEKGYIGIGSPRVGDEIWALFGGDSPFVLRRRPDSSNRQFVSECYSHGNMDGVALLDRDGARKEGAILSFFDEQGYL